MFAKYALTESIKQTTFERIILKFKNPEDKAMGDAFLKDMRQSITPFRD
jgi:hypothetical protein